MDELIAHQHEGTLQPLIVDGGPGLADPADAQSTLAELLLQAHQPRGSGISGFLLLRRNSTA